MPVSPQSTAKPMPRIDQWPLRGGVACLDFANTLAWRPNLHPVEGLRGYDDLLLWSRSAGLLSIQEERGLMERAARDAAGSNETLTGAILLREAIYGLFSALAHERPWDQGDLATISSTLTSGLVHAALIPDGDGFAMRFQASASGLALPLWKIADSAAQLLVDGRWRRVRECPGHDCGWLFLDTTKNANRRWCDSADCGNRARVRAHARRRRAQSAGNGS